jgi:glutamate dehydrogenase/leucine dehydrogenase
VHNLNCKVLVEAANGPVTTFADDYLFKKKILVLPDILVNSGTAISSYFEWLKNIDHAIPGKMTKRVIFIFD